MFTRTGFPINLDQAIDYFADNLTDHGRATLQSEDAHEVVKYIKSCLTQLRWCVAGSPFMQFIKTEFGLHDYTDISYLICQGVLADLTDSMFNPYEFAIECRNLWSSQGKDPATGKTIVEIGS